jgi:hypothetical protein
MRTIRAGLAPLAQADRVLSSACRRGGFTTGCVGFPTVESGRLDLGLLIYCSVRL